MDIFNKTYQSRICEGNFMHQPFNKQLRSLMIMSSADLLYITGHCMKSILGNYMQI